MQERAQQRKEMEAVVRDRDVLGSQLVRRNDELALLHEKIWLQQSTISQGNAAYRCAPLPIFPSRTRFRTVTDVYKCTGWLPTTCIADCNTRMPCACRYSAVGVPAV